MTAYAVSEYRHSVRRPPPLEKVEQSGIVQLAGGVLRGKAYVIGTRRGKKERDHGTHQTPGLADLFIVLPGLAIMWECKRDGQQGARSQAQLEFAEWCGIGEIAYGHGTLNDFIAEMIRRGRLKPDQVAHYRLPRERGGL